MSKPLISDMPPKPDDIPLIEAVIVEIATVLAFVFVIWWIYGTHP